MVEGFYGPPWSHRDRLEVIAFCAERGMNAYVYAPKDDPYHRDQWRDPYPAGKLAELVELVEQAAELYVGMFRETVWRDFVDAGMPEQGWTRIQAIVEGLQPVAAQAMLASFRSAMAAAVAAEVEADLAHRTVT